MKQQQTSVQIPAGNVQLEGDLVIPQRSQAIVLFAHGSGSGRHSPRNKYVASVLNEGGLATLLIDLLTAEEESVDLATAELRFDIEFLGQRLVCATDWLSQNSSTGKLPIGYFGASTGAAAALVAASLRPKVVYAIVSRGGRPDLALGVMPKIQAPTLLIVGGHDHAVIRMNQTAFEALTCVKELKIVPGATHLFEEPGTLEQVAQLASQWFTANLKA